ncbi:hypothetical protein ASE08_21585 [Rhizobacter sp. Root16D2]|nr:hypothetical protein ASE08_21585 [Rhizobacter sp. Root16D2]
MNEPYRYFVEDDNDAGPIEHVAYSLFKRDKLAFIASHTSAHSSAPSFGELGAFIRGALLPDRVKAYLAEAEVLLQGFAEATLDAAGNEAEERHRQHYYDELKKARPVWKMMWDNMLANMLALIITAFVVIAFYGTKISAVSMLGEIFGYEIKERPKPEFTAERPASGVK